MSWRNSEGGYLRNILMARVYDVAVETPLEEAVRLSEQVTSAHHNPLMSTTWRSRAPSIRCRG